MAVALTTKDNPYNPFDDFTNWYLYDTGKGYDSCGYLARIANASDDAMSEHEIEEETERAIDEILKYDFTGNYMKVYSSS